MWSGALAAKRLGSASRLAVLASSVLALAMTSGCTDDETGGAGGAAAAGGTGGSGASDGAAGGAGGDGGGAGYQPGGSCTTDDDCPGLLRCGGAGTPGACGCTPAECPANACGALPDGCGHVTDCGSCSGGAECGGAGTPNRCAVPAAAQDVAACGPLSGGSHYVLVADLSSGGDCFTIDGEQQIFFDGAGRSVDAGGAAFRITGRSTDITIRDVTAAGGVAIEGAVVDGCETNPERIWVSNVHVTSGGLSASSACAVAFEDCSLDDGGISLDSPWFLRSDFRVMRSDLSGPLWLYNVQAVAVHDNTIADNVQLMSDQGYSQDNALCDNTISSSTGYPDTYDVLRLRSLKKSLVAGNRVESAVADAAVVVKLYDNRGNLFSGNHASALGSPVHYGVLELRSACQDNVFYANELMATQGGAGIMSHFSNTCCDQDANFPPPGGDCVAPYTENCYERRNLFDSNLIVGGATGVWHYGDGRDNRYVNNVIVADQAVVAGGCEAASGGAAFYYNNTLHGSSAAVAFDDDCALVARNNIFFSDGAASVAGAIRLTGAFNLFQPAASVPDSLSGDPHFVDAASADPVQRDYHLGAGSPAREVGDPATADAPMNVLVDKDGTVRPQGAGFDLGAYEQ